MLYNFESNALNKQGVLSEAFILAENICDEFSLEDHFAVISLALQELLSLVIRHDEKSTTEYFIDSIVESDEIAFQIRKDGDFKFLEKELFHNDEGILVMTLSDEIEISEDYTSICIMFHVKPKRKSEAEKRESIYKENKKKFLYTEDEIDEIKRRLKHQNLHF